MTLAYTFSDWQQCQKIKVQVIYSRQVSIWLFKICILHYLLQNLHMDKVGHAKNAFQDFGVYNKELSISGLDKSFNLGVFFDAVIVNSLNSAG